MTGISGVETAGKVLAVLKKTTKKTACSAERRVPADLTEEERSPPSGGQGKDSINPKVNLIVSPQGSA